MSPSFGTFGDGWESPGEDKLSADARPTILMYDTLNGGVARIPGPELSILDRIEAVLLAPRLKQLNGVSGRVLEQNL
jgi:hypothetical protein